MNIELVGFAAGILGVISLVPQVAKSWKTKSTDDISILWNILSISSQAMWISYGVLISSISLIVMSAVNLLLTLTLLALKVRYTLQKK